MKTIHKEYYNKDKIYINNNSAHIVRYNGGSIRIPLPENEPIDLKIEIVKNFINNGYSGKEICN